MSFIYHYELFYDLWTNFEMWYVLDLNIYDYELFFLFILFLMYVYVYKIFLLLTLMSQVPIFYSPSNHLAIHKFDNIELNCFIH